MPVVVPVPRPRASQPAQPGIDLTSSLARGLVFAAVPGVGDAVSGARATAYGTAQISGGRNGRQYVSDDTGNDAVAIALAAANKLYGITTNLTIALWIEPQSVTSYTNFFSIPYRSGSWADPYNALTVYRNSGDANKTILQWATSSSSSQAAQFSAEHIATGTGSYACYVLTRNGSACSIYKNGVLIDTATASGNSAVDFVNRQPVVLLNATESSLPNAGYAGICDGCDIWDRALSEAEVAAYFRARFSLFTPRRSSVLLPAAGGGTTPVGLVTETDTAQPITANQARAVGLQSETDTALAITARSTIAAGQPSETDTALPIAAAQSITLGIPSETDTAQAIALSAPGTLGLQQETDTALPMAAGQVRTAGLQSEADSALPLAVLLSRALGLQSEADTALPITVLLPSVGVGLATEGDTALPITVIGASTGAAPDYPLPHALARRKKVTVIHKDDQAEREAEFQELLARVKGQGSTKGRAAAKRAATGPLDASAPAFEPPSIPRMPEVTGVPADALRRWMPQLLEAFRIEYRTGYADQLQGLARAAAHNQALLDDEEEVAILAAML